MPRLMGYRERLPFNRWDCWFYGDAIHARDGARLFDDPSHMALHEQMITNMMIPGQIENDATGVVMNWYARTNIPAGPLRDALFQGVTATFTIGNKQMSEMPVSELLQRSEGAPAAITEAEQAAQEDERLALLNKLSLLAYRAYWNPAGELLDPNWDYLDGPRSAEFKRDHNKWLAVADVLYRELNPVIRRPYIIPVRQNFCVRIEANDLPRVHEAIRRLDATNYDADGKRILVLDPPEGHPADHPGLWIHLEGLQTRDVC